MQLSRPLDSIDRKIVALLQESAKRTFADIGADVGLSATAVKRRVDRLEGDGVIIGYGARINWRALGEAIESLIEIYCADRTSPADVGRSLAKVDEIVSAFTVSGEADAVIRVRVDSIEHLERLVERLRRDPNIVRTRTLIVLSTLLDRRMTETFAPPDIAMERRDDGTIILASRRPVPEWEPSITAVLRKRAAEHPDRPLAAQRDAEDRWVTLTYGEARRAATRSRARSLELGLGPERPVMILSGNSLEHLLVSLAAYAARAPAMPISVAYSLMSADHARIRAIAELTEPGLVFADDAGPFGPALSTHSAAQVPQVLVARGDRDGALRLDEPARPRRQSARWRPRSGRDRQTPIHIRIDRHPQGGHQHPPDAVLEPGDDARRSGRSWPTSRRCSSTGCRGATRSAATTT